MNGFWNSLLSPMSAIMNYLLITIWTRTDQAGIQDLETVTIDIPQDNSGVAVLYLEMQNLLLALLGS
jgi:hypothetical protein